METRKDMRRLIELVKSQREKLGLSMRKLADIAGLDHSFIAKFERGAYDSVSAETLMAFAESLQIPATDLFSLAGYRLPDSLPSFGPYLRTRYGEELNDDDLSALTHMFESLRSSHDRDEEDRSDRVRSTR